MEALAILAVLSASRIPFCGSVVSQKGEAYLNTSVPNAG